MCSRRLNSHPSGIGSDLHPHSGSDSGSDSDSDMNEIHETHSTTSYATEATSRPHETGLKEAIIKGDLSSTLFHLRGDHITDSENDKNDTLLLAAEQGWYIVVKALTEINA